MTDRSSILFEVIALPHRETFSRIVSKYKGHEKVRHFTCRQQFICMVFVLLTWKVGLRSIQDRLNARTEQLHHLGFNKPVFQSTLADANETRDWHIGEQVALQLIKKAGNKIHNQIDIKHFISIFFEIMEAEMSGVKWLDNLTFQTDAIYVFNRGYIDFARFHNIEENSAIFITRA